MMGEEEWIKVRDLLYVFMKLSLIRDFMCEARYYDEFCFSDIKIWSVNLYER